MKLKDMLHASALEQIKQHERFKKDFPQVFDPVAKSERERFREMLDAQDSFRRQTEALISPLSKSLATTFLRQDQLIAESLRNTFARFEEMSRSATLAVAGLAKLINKSVPENLFKDLATSLLHVADGYRRYRDEVHPELIRVLKKRGWGAMYTFTPREAAHLVKLSKERGAKAVDDYICRMHRRHNHMLVRQAVKRWRDVPYLRERSAIVREAIKAHRERRYVLSIPALLPLVDGLATEVLLSKEGQKRYRMAVNEAAKQDTDGFWGDLLLCVVETTVYANFDRTTNAKPRWGLNRHAILHGEVRSYQTEANSLRVILLLDMFAGIALNLPEKKLAQAAAPGN